MNMDIHAPTLRARLSPVLRAALAATAAVAMLAPATQTRAASEAIIVVNTVADENNTGAACSLREAITASSTDAAFGGCTAGANIDTITFNIEPNSVITLTGAEPVVNNGGGVVPAVGKVIIDGSTAVNLTVNRTTPGRLLKVDTLTADVTLKGFTMSGGRVVSTSLSFASGDGSGGAVLSLGPAVVLENMVFRNNHADNLGGAVYAGSVITMTNTRFENNSAGFSGGAVYAGFNKSGISSVASSQFLSNTAQFEGGAFFQHGSVNIPAEERRLSVNNSLFVNNSVTATFQSGIPAARGGAILSQARMDISRSRFENNRSTVFCGAVMHYNAQNNGPGQLVQTTTTVTDSVFINNDAQLGGGLCADGPLTVVTSQFELNDAALDDGAAVRGRYTTTIVGSTFLTNTAKSKGGAVSVAPNPSQPANRMSISRSVFRNNSIPTGGIGGAVFGIDLATGSSISNSLFVGNTSASGGAIGINGGATTTLAVQFSTFVNNVSTASGPLGAIDTLSLTQMTVNNSIFANNAATALNEQASSTLTENYNLFFSNTVDRSAGVPAGANSASGNPNFVSATDFHLTAASTNAIDKASAAPANAIDFDGDARPIGAARDLGYDEFNPNSAITGLALLSSSPTRLDNATLFTATVATGSGVVYDFNFGDGSPVMAGSAMSTTSHTYAAEGSYTAIVTATNSFGTASRTVVVNVTNSAPTANAGPDLSAAPGDTVNLNGAGSADADGHTPLSYQWTQTGGAAVTLSNATIASPSFTAPATPGALTFSLIVTDAKGKASAADTVTININASAISGLQGTATSPTTLGTATRFEATVAGGATPITYEWNFGDGSPVATGAVVSHTYAAVGGYTVLLTATNSAGSVVAAPISVAVVKADFKIYLPVTVK